MSSDSVPILKKHAYKDQVFCWIESGETSKVKRFLEMYEHHAKQLTTMSNWNLPMLASRYGNLELLQFLLQKKFMQEPLCQYSMIHAACYGNELEILKYLIDTLRKEPQSLSDQQPVLKICFRAENMQIAEYLISRGAFYQYGTFFHNLKHEVVTQQNAHGQTAQINVYRTIQRGKSGAIIEIDVPIVIIFFSMTIQKDSIMSPFLRFQRIRNYAYLKRFADSQNPLPVADEKKKENLSYLMKIAYDNGERGQVVQSKILEYLVGKKELPKEQLSLSANPQQPGAPNQPQQSTPA